MKQNGLKTLFRFNDSVSLEHATKNKGKKQALHPNSTEHPSLLNRKY